MSAGAQTGITDERVEQKYKATRHLFFLPRSYCRRPLSLTTTYAIRIGRRGTPEVSAGAQTAITYEGLNKAQSYKTPILSPPLLLSSASFANHDLMLRREAEKNRMVQSGCWISPVSRVGPARGARKMFSFSAPPRCVAEASSALSRSTLSMATSRLSWSWACTVRPRSRRCSPHFPRISPLAAFDVPREPNLSA